MNVVLSYGLGVDSTALLLRWLKEPDSRNFDLRDLIVVTAMTGDEWPRTGVLVRSHILPRLREAGVLFAQVARRGPSQSEGIAVLDESTSPERLHLAGAYKLSDELTRAGTVPQVSGNRRCSMKFKGWVIDTYLAHHAPQATRHAFGYESSETARADRCAEQMHIRLVLGYERDEGSRAAKAGDFDTPHRIAEFPLIEWGWDRERCERYIERITGVPDWPKSACCYCPFAMSSRAGEQHTLERFDRNPARALRTLLLERRSICINPRSGLRAGKRLADLVAEQRPALWREFHRHLEGAEHSLYEVRRVWRPRADDPLNVANANRELRVLATGTKAACEARLRCRGALDKDDGIPRLYLHRRGETLPAREHFLVAGPAGAEDKALPSFAGWWQQLEQPQLSLDPT